MYRIFLSLRYLRSRPTNWIGMAGIFVGVGAMILILSIMAGFLAESRTHVRGSLSDVIIQPLFEQPVEVGDGRIPREPEPMLAIVREHPAVEAACAQLQWYGMITRPGRGHVVRDPVAGKIALVSLVGVDVGDEYQATGLRESLERRSRFAVEPVADLDDPFASPPGYEPDGRPRPSVILGHQLAAHWGLHRGDEVEITTTSVDPQTGQVGDPSNFRYVVGGTFRSGDNEVDMGRIYLDRRELMDLLGGDTLYSSLLVKLKNYERDARTVVEELSLTLAEAGLLHDWRIDPRFAEYREVRTWEEFRQTLLKAIENEKTLMGIMLSLVIIVAGFTVFALLSMMVSEKRRDIGVLCALGATNMGVMSMFLLIGFWEAVIGATAGTITGIIAAQNIDPIERWLSDTFNVQIFNRDVYLFDHIPSVIEPVGVGLIVLGAFASTLLFAAIPAWRASRLNPVDALRYE